MTDIHGALGELLAVQRDRVTLAVPNLAALGDLIHANLPDAEITLVKQDLEAGILHERVQVAYRVTAPCRLAQLQDAVLVGSERAGGRGSGGSRPLVAADALDLWRDVATSAGMWAVAVGVDRSRYLKHAEAAPRRTADLVHAPARVFATVDTPPVGRLLRAAATEADRRGYDAMVATIAKQARSWAGQIDALFGAPESKAIRGVSCPDCDAVTVLEGRDVGDRTEAYRVPALMLSYGWLDGVTLPYRWCRACGTWAWLDESAAA